MWLRLLSSAKDHGETGEADQCNARWLRDGSPDGSRGVSGERKNVGVSGKRDAVYHDVQTLFGELGDTCQSQRCAGREVDRGFF